MFILYIDIILMLITETFLLSSLTLLLGFFTGVVGMCYRSKCKDLSCCCFHVVRDIEAEEKEDLAAVSAQRIPDNTV